MKKLYTNHTVYLLFVICWFSYFSTYLGRLNFTACISEMNVSDGFSKAGLGQVSSAFFILYGAGQLFSGFLADRLCPKWLVGVGLIGSALFNWGMAASHTVEQMTVLWGLNGLVQSMAWAPLVRTVADLAFAEQCARICLNLATTTPLGTLAAYLAAALCIARGEWRVTFVIGGGVMLAAALLWMDGITLLEREAERDGMEEPCAADIQATGDGSLTVKRIMVHLLPIGLAVLLHGLLKEGIITWAPSYLQENCGFSTAFSVTLTMVVPVVNLSGVYLANMLHVRRLRNEMATAFVCFTVCGAGILAWLISGYSNLILSFTMLLLSTTCMTGVSTMLLSLLPLRFRSVGLVATVTGLLNAVTYFGSAASSAGIGMVLDRWGWNTVLETWLVVAIIGSLVCAALSRGWKRFAGMLDLERKGCPM